MPGKTRSWWNRVRSATHLPTRVSEPARHLRTNSPVWRIARLVAICAVVALTLLPLANIVTIISTTGANNPSNDEVAFITQFLDQVLDGTYNWQNFARDTFVGTHSMLIPGLIYIGVARFANFDMYVMLFIGIAAATLKLLLFHDTLTYASKGRTSRLLLWPMLAALVFSVSQMSVFEYGNTAMPIGFSQLGLALGIWGLVRFPKRWRGAAIMAGGGIIGSLSWGSGPIMWPVFLLGMLILRFRKLAHYAIWLVAAGVAALPYLGPLLLQRSQGGMAIYSLLNYQFILGVLGWPLSQKVSLIPNTETIATAGIGLALCVAGLSGLWIERRSGALRQSAPALMLMAFSILTTWQASLFRQYTAPWYASNAMLFWIGLLGLAYVVWDNRHVALQLQPFPSDAVHRIVLPKHIRLMPPAWSLAAVTALALLYLRSNLTYEDKTFYLPFRAPVSASCLRNYRIAPTYCEGSVAGWGMGNQEFLARLARPLEAHNLSVFAPRQEWTLQGDFGLDNVRIKQTPGVPEISWSADLTNKPMPWSSYKHLNLFLHTPNAIEWTIYLPANLVRADFHSAAAISQSAQPAPGTDGVTFQMYLDVEGKGNTLAFSEHLGPNEQQWHPFTVPLTEYAGKTITIRLTSSPGQNVSWDWAMYRYPHIDVEVDPKVPVDPTAGPGRFVPLRTPSDAVFDVNDPSIWEVSGMQRAPGEGGKTPKWVIDGEPSLTYLRPLNLPLGNYTHIYVRMAASPDIFPRLMRVYVRLQWETAFREIQIPLFRDGELHDYSYDLKLLGLPKKQELAEIRLVPVSMNMPGQAALPVESKWVTIADFRLIGSGDATAAPPLSLGAAQMKTDTAPGEILAGHTLGQTFRSDLPNLAAIDLPLATYARRASGRVIFHLRDSPEAKSDLRSVEIQADTVIDNAWRRFEFTPIPDSGGRSYYFFLEAPDGVSGKAITAWSTSTDTYADGTMMVDHKPANGDLAFRTAHLVK